ncbi:MAG: response regulator [bacterium]
MDIDTDPIFTDFEEEKPTVLLADDNEPTLALLREYFVKANEKGHLACNIILASDGQEAIDLIDTLHPEIVICDIRMSKKNGFEVLEHFNNWSRKQNPYCFFCFISNMEEEKAHAFKEGVDGFLAKKALDYFPFTLQLKSWLRLVAFERKYGGL